VQKFTRPLTREVELAGGRLAFTFSEQGIAVRPVGSRRPPREITWGALVLHMTGHAGAPTSNPSPEQLAPALESLRKGEGSSPAAPAASPAETMPSAQQVQGEP
jgi:hypothetical protein